MFNGYCGDFFLLRILLHFFTFRINIVNVAYSKIKLIEFLVKANKFILLISKISNYAVFATIELFDSFYSIVPHTNFTRQGAKGYNGYNGFRTQNG